MNISGTHEVVYIGPFYTGYFINTSALINQGYIKAQEDTLNELKSRKYDEWFIETDRKKDLIWDIEYKSVFGGTTKVPPSFIGKKISYSDRIVDFKDSRMHIKELILFYHDYGIGTFRVVIDVELTQEIEIRAFRELIEQFSPKIGDIINNLVEKSTSDLESTLNSISIPIESYKNINVSLKEKGLPPLNFGCCLWYHRIFNFKLDKNGPITQEDFEKYKPLLFSSQMIGPQNCSLNEYAMVFPSFGYSLFIYDVNNQPEDIRLNRILELAEYYYAATSLLDTILFNRLNKFSRFEANPHKIKDVKVELESLKDLNEELELFLLLLKDSIVNFTPSSVIMWRNLDREWYYTPILESLKEKNELLNSKVNAKFEELTQRRSESLNRMIKIFTIFSILGPILEIYSILLDIGVFDMIINNIELFTMFFLPILAVILITFLYYGRKAIST